MRAPLRTLKVQLLLLCRPATVPSYMQAAKALPSTTITTFLVAAGSELLVVF